MKGSKNALILAAAFAGLVSQSWTIFAIGLLAGVVLKLYDGDIRELTADFLQQDLSIEPNDLFAIVGGPPCQAFSTAGRRLGLNDDRGNVFLHFVHLLFTTFP